MRIGLTAQSLAVDLRRRVWGPSVGSGLIGRVYRNTGKLLGRLQ